MFIDASDESYNGTGEGGGGEVVEFVLFRSGGGKTLDGETGWEDVVGTVGVGLDWVG